MLISLSRWICFSLLSVLVMSGCALGKKAGATGGGEVEDDRPDCPEGVGATDGDAPKLVVKIGQNQIMVCGSEAPSGAEAQGAPATEPKIVAEDATPKTPSQVDQVAPDNTKPPALDNPRVSLSEFNVYSLGEGGRLSSSLREIAGVNNFEIYQEGMALVFDEMLLFNGSWTPAFRSSLECKEEECEFVPEKCVLNVPNAGEPKDLIEIRSYVHGKNKGQSPDVKLIERVATLAYSGNKSAQKFFLQPPNQLKLEGQAGEVFSGVAGMISSLQASKCLK